MKKRKAERPSHYSRLIPPSFQRQRTSRQNEQPERGSGQVCVAVCRTRCTGPAPLVAAFDRRPTPATRLGSGSLPTTLCRSRLSLYIYIGRAQQPIQFFFSRSVAETQRAAGARHATLCPPAHATKKKMYRSNSRPVRDGATCGPGCVHRCTGERAPHPSLFSPVQGNPFTWTRRRVNRNGESAPAAGVTATGWINTGG